MSEGAIEFILRVAIHILMTLVNGLFVMWFWNDGLVGAVDGVHPVEYWKALMIYLLVYSLFQPIFKSAWDEKNS